ncbi:DgyrCDS13786 [Dimorphilus gyrociliatus]|uniref:DgyrCDS13786 n=1 Tax=Dimorphilus gyrociliatus TaxID=2664684 RepID=A0A7I8WBP9_9ANNE|nr:DgyrCDS13786 [Dimorphilus gyrociliatus]
MASGVKVNDDVVTRAVEMNLHKGTPLRYLRFVINSVGTFIEIQEEKERDKTENGDEEGQKRLLNELTDTLSDKDCCYILYDFGYVPGSGQATDKLLFIVWCPDSASVRNKMLYASSKDAIKNKLSQLAFKEVQANDLSALSYEAVLDKVLH